MSAFNEILFLILFLLCPKGKTFWLGHSSRYKEHLNKLAKTNNIFQRQGSFTLSSLNTTEKQCKLKLRKKKEKKMERLTA